MSKRQLTESERVIIKKLLSYQPELWNRYVNVLDSVRVTEMLDGGMGSLFFESERAEERSLSKSIAEGEFLDSDNITVSVTLNVDQYDDLLELDAWKTDFSPLISWPEPDQIVLKT